MTDIVERLRHFSANTRDEYLHELAGRAADEIERLRRHADALAGALEKIALHTDELFTQEISTAALAAYRKGEG